MKLEVIVHVYNPPGVVQYAHQLRWLNNSLLNYSMRSERSFRNVTLSVCFTVLDQPTKGMMMALSDLHGAPGPYQVVARVMPPAALFRRGCGRHECAKATGADVVWFTDADYFVDHHFLDQMAKYLGPDACLTYPKHVNVNVDHETGDRMVLGEFQIVPDLFMQTKMRKAIGGIQFVGGNIARDHGYGKGKWIRPVDDPELGFRQCRCDVHYRRFLDQDCGVKVRRVNAEGLYRIRHTTDGRDYDQGGNKGTDRENW